MTARSMSLWEMSLWHEPSSTTIQRIIIDVFQKLNVELKRTGIKSFRIFYGTFKFSTRSYFELFFFRHERKKLLLRSLHTKRRGVVRWQVSGRGTNCTQNSRGSVRLQFSGRGTNCTQKPLGSVRWQFSGCQYKSYTKRRGSVRMDILSVRRPLIRLVACFRRSSVQSLLCSATTVPVLVPTDPKRQKPLLVQYLLSSPPQNQSKSDFLTHYITVLVVL